jgi:hypothetical protein
VEIGIEDVVVIIEIAGKVVIVVVVSVGVVVGSRSGSCRYICGSPV